MNLSGPRLRTADAGGRRPLLRGAAWALLLLGLFAAGCPRTTLNDFPIHTGGTCSVELGAPREHVLLRCGPPCGGGPIAPDLTCDVYGSAELCYRDGTIATLQRLGAWGDRFAWCGWSETGESIPAL